MIDANKLSGFIERVEGDYRPITADVFLTDYCNNRCTYCRFSRRTGDYVTYKDFVRLLDRLLEIGVKGIILTGGGEPTINPDFDKICNLLERRGIPYGVNTNFNQLHFVAPNFLKISIDEGSPDKYLATRGVDTLNVVLSNVRQFVKWKTENGKKTRVGVQCVTTRKEQVSEFYEAVRDIYLDYIQFRPVELQSGQLCYTDICAAIDGLAQKDSRIIKSYKYAFADWKPKKCYANWSAICVNPRLDVLYCCARPDEVIGNIFDNDILDKLCAYIPDMRLCETPCRLTGANAYIMQYKNDGDRYFI